MVSVKKAELSKVVYEKGGNIATITLNYPEKLNVFDFPGQGGVEDQFFAALDEAAKDDDIKVVVIKGAGRAFSAGHDLDTVGFVYGMGTEREHRTSQRIRLKVDRDWLYRDHGMKLFLHPKITIAQVHGYCTGEGVIIVAECDLAIAAEDTQIGHMEQRIGFSGSGISTLSHLILTIGLKRMLDVILTGRLIDGKEAERIGLVNKAVPANKLEEEVNKLARAICLLPRDGIAVGKITRHLIYDSLGLTASHTAGYISHTLFTNLRWEPNEYNFFRERRDKGTKVGFHGRDVRYAGLV